MYNITYENQGNNTYLVCQMNEENLDTMSLGMLTNNRIPGFADSSFMQLDTSKYVKYNVSAKISVAQLFAGQVNRKRLIGVFSGIVDAMLSAEDYMLDTASILLDLNYIFTDVTTCDTVLICLPVLQPEQPQPELNKFFKNILFTTQFDQTENCDYVAQILNYLNSVPNLSLADFKSLLDNISKPKAAPAVHTPVAPQPVSQPVPQPAPQPASPQPPVQPPQAPAGGWQPVIPQGAAPAYGQPAAPVAPPVKETKKNKKAQQPAAPAPANFAVPGQQPQQAQAAPGNFAVPGQQPQQPAPAAAEPGDKPMSWLYLMQHYNKDNVAKYKEQQQAKKAAGPAPKAPKEPKPGKQPQPVPGNFAVPGQKPQQPAPNFAVPGQQPQQPAPNFAVPGQKPQQPAPNFAVPGQKPQQPAPNFAVPGQKPQQPAPNFAVPGQKPQQPAPNFAVPGQKPQQPAPNFAVPGQKPQQPVPAQPQFQPAPQPQVPVQQPVPQPMQQPAFNSINFGETTVLGEDFGATTVLSAPTAAEKPKPYLLRQKNNERIPLDKPVFRIGKEKSYVDYFVADNPAISRSHANIINREGVYYVVDTNSTNHTYVNNVMSPSNAETKLNHGDKLTLGNEEFEFKML